MKDMYKTRKEKLISTAAVFLSAAVLLGGTAIRTRVRAEDLSVPDTESVMRIGPSESYVNDVPVTAGTNADALVKKSGRDVKVFIDGSVYPGRAFLYRDTTYVGIREFATNMVNASVTWNAKNSTATAKTASVTVTAKKGNEYITANGRYLWTRTGVIIENGTMYVPVRALCTAFGSTLKWDGTNYTVSIKKGSGTIKTGSSFYDPDEVYWLSKIIHAESRGESMTGKIAVGNVVLNRVRSKDYPNTIYGVIFDRKHGVQFSPVADGSINLSPDADSVIAAKLCLEGYTVSESIMFFINKNIASNMWVTANRPLAVSIGKHDFYA